LLHTRLSSPSSCYRSSLYPVLHSFPTRRSSDLVQPLDDLLPHLPIQLISIHPPTAPGVFRPGEVFSVGILVYIFPPVLRSTSGRSEEHTSELQSRENLVCRLLLEKKKKNSIQTL